MSCRRIPWLLTALLAASGCESVVVGGGEKDGEGYGGGWNGVAPDASDWVPADAEGARPPPASWKEHWQDHSQDLALAHHDDDVAIYLDGSVGAAATAWLAPRIGDVWRYTREAYGEFGLDRRLYVVLHQGDWIGGHAATRDQTSHDLRNVIDVSAIDWTDADDWAGLDAATAQVGAIVERSARDRLGAPARALWGERKFGELFQVDVYQALGWTDAAERLRLARWETVDATPRAGTYWFRDFLYPAWRDHGGAQLMPRFFELLAAHFPSNGQTYSRDLKLHELVHFLSGAARHDLAPLARTAFGGPYAQEMAAARALFPEVVY